MGLPAEEQNQFLEGVSISEVMSAPPVFIGPEAPVQDAARAMAEHKIGCLPVVENGKVAGIITETDLLRYFAGLPVDPASRGEAASDSVRGPVVGGGN
jgi:CBS domain-containing protein